MQVHQGVTEKRVHQTLEVTLNGTSVLCRKKEWEEKNGVRLSVPQ